MPGQNKVTSAVGTTKDEVKNDISFRASEVVEYEVYRQKVIHSELNFVLQSNVSSKRFSIVPLFDETRRGLKKTFGIKVFGSLEGFPVFSTNLNIYLLTLPTYKTYLAIPAMLTAWLGLIVLACGLNIPWGRVKDIPLATGCLFWASLVVICTSFFSMWFKLLMDVKFRCKFFKFLLPLCFTLISFVLFVAAHRVFKIGAFPMHLSIGAFGFVLYVVVFLYLAIAPCYRTREVFMRGFWACAVITYIALIFGILYPLLNVRFIQANPNEQLLLTAGFVICKKMFEVVSTAAAERMNSDVYPLIYLYSTMAYSFFVSSVRVSVKSFLVYVAFVGSEAWENCIHIYKVYKEKRTENELQEDAPEIRNRRERLICMVAIYAVREITEIVSPLVYLLLTLIFYHTNKRLHNNFWKMSEEELKKSVTYLAMDIGIETTILILFSRVVGKKLNVPLFRVVARLYHYHFWPFLLAGCTILSYDTALQLAPCGTDWNFDFYWLKEDANWLAGQCWILPEHVSSENRPTCVEECHIDLLRRADAEWRDIDMQNIFTMCDH